ncbi:MAG: hypothetical protein MUF68_09205 [Cyclobacteriaceae bacterium]|nr:hypothetical protein [Cyclobacteriaceae bacterium]
MRTESALQMLNRVKEFNIEWVRKGYRLGQNVNNVSATVSIKDHEWEEIGNWMWENKASYNGLSVLPYDNGNYKQPPFEDISKEDFIKMEKSLKEIDLSQVFEFEDETDLQAEAACTGGACVVQ